MTVRILVPLDGSSLAGSALAHAVSLAEPSDTHLALLRVVERTTAQHSVDPLDWHLQRSEAQAYLEQAGHLVAEYLSNMRGAKGLTSSSLRATVAAACQAGT